ncbi:hypothetical protein QYE76_037979 [Lolium multiflorum]|uniref:Uncharacterized protein n=1 Tax=Lolium multiflorum TaxID=4521 RepID=A0AAD8WSH1_LOLMU|nr:hypothetical protein QYE76_037979 [Lolium multiflorum]
MWEIIVDGYRKPQDPIRLTSTEFYNRQLNASACDKIRSGINRKLLDQVNDIDSAKELWDRIVVLQEGTNLIQKDLYESAKTEATLFMIREGESMADAYGRLGALRVKVKGLGCEKYNDGFEMNEEFIKSKVIAMIAVKQKDTNLALNLQILTKQADLTADDLVSYVAANDNMAKAGEKLMEMNRADGSSHDLALKARADQEREEAYELEEVEMTSTSDMQTDVAFFVRKYVNKYPISSKEKKRTCYNCDEDSHFANECPYEKRVDKPKFVKDEEKEAGVAGLAFSKPGSLFTYDYSKDYSMEFSTPNDIGSSFMARTTYDDDPDDISPSTIVGSCLMAREAKVMESPPSLSSILDDETDNQDEVAMLKELFKARCTLRGDALVKFGYLMDSLKERNESIEELEYHMNDEKRRFNLLRQELKNERCISQGLKQLVETFELDKAKDQETIERAQLMAQELDASKKELEVAHASLTKDLDHLEKANKLVKDELKKLGENHDLLQDTYKKALGSLNDPIIAKDVACSSTSFTYEHAKLVEEHVRLKEELSLYVETNVYLESLVTKYGLNYYPNDSACEQATILEENARLTKELAKFTTAKNKMGLDDLLSNQRPNNQKYGLGYAPKPYKKNNYKKEKPAQEKNKKVTNNGKAPKGKATSGDRTGPNNHYALFVDYYGDVYAEYVGPRNGYAYRGACVAGKQLKKRHPIKSIVTTSRPLELLHLDLFGPSHYDTLGGSKYGLVIVDDYSRYSWVFLLKSKDETYREFIIFAKKAQRMYESEIKAIRTDNGTEFKNYTMQEFVDDEGIKREFSAPYTPQQNGVVERKNRTIIEMTRTMLSEFKSPHNFWGEAIYTVVHYSNRLFLRPLHNKTPNELLTGNKPNVMYIRVFGCKCLVKDNRGKVGKFETRTIEGTFVGYAENSHAYRYYKKSTGTIEVSCDVVFLEDNGSQVEQAVPCAAGDDDPSNAIKLMGIGHIRPTEVHTNDQDDGIEASSSAQVEPCSTQAEPSNAAQDPTSTQDEPHSEEQEESPKPSLQVRQLAKGTFISQEKYVRDMLKKFDMTNASPMKTPTPIKGQLGSCNGEKDVDIKVALVMTVELLPRRASIRGPQGAVQAPVYPAEQLKAVVQAVQLEISGWRRLRDENPYRFEERTYTGDDKEFWTETQAAIWDEFYNCAALMKNGIIVMPKAINKEELTMFQTTKYRFVVDTLQKMGLLNLVCLKPTHFKSLGEYCPILVRHFHCTVFFHDDPARTMTWMTGKEKYSCNYLDLCEAMGFGSGRARGFQIHSQEQFTHGNIAFCYPPEPTHDPPLISGMYYSYQVLAKIFRESLVSKSRDSSDCRSYHLNLMYYCRPENVRTIDGCDYLYNELKRFVRNMMTPNFAQYVQQLINTVVPSPYNKKDEVVKMDPFKIPQQGHKLDIPEMMPSERRTKERHDPAASSSSSSSMCPKRGASRFLASLWQMCRNTNDVAHQSLALNQETRRRQNEFMAARNHPVPPPGPELEPVVAPTWAMPPIDDNMFQNFDLSLFARGGSSHGAPPPRTRSRAAPASDAAGSSSIRTGDDEENEDYDEEESTSQHFY